jgi:phytoene dehydrogenase-like protein
MIVNSHLPPQRSSYDAVVVGSGHNGLVAAAYLARAGWSVLVLERNPTFGGATASQRVFPSYDAMLSRYSYLVSLFPEQITRELGLNFQTRRRRTASFTPYQDAQGQPQGLILSNVDPSRSRESMHQMTGTSTAWDRYQQLLELESTIAKLIWPTMLEPLRSRAWFESQLRSSLEKEAWESFIERPLGQVIERYADHDALRGLLLTDGKIGVFTHAHDESLLQNRCFLYHIIGNETGEWKVPVGGMKSLVDALINCCLAHGVEFRAEAAARHLELGPHRHRITYGHGETERAVDARYVLLNAGPRTAASLLGEPWQPDPEDEGSVIKMNFLMKRLPKLKAAHLTSAEAFAGSFHIDEGYAQMQASWAAARDGQIPQPAPGELYCHTLTDDSILAPELRRQGFHTLTLFGLDMPWRLFTQHHESQKAEVARRYLEGLDRLCDESFADCIARDGEGQLCMEIKTPHDLRQELDLDQGNIFHNAPSWFFAKDENAVGTWGVETNFPRVIRAGSSAIRGGAVSGIPGRNAAMMAIAAAHQ